MVIEDLIKQYGLWAVFFGVMIEGDLTLLFAGVLAHYGLFGFSADAHATIFPAMLPGFTWITWPSFFLGAGEVFVYGWYFAVVFGVIFNFFAARLR